MNNEDIIKKVNETQMQASNPKYSIWTAASAGSGKTTVLVKRLIRLLLNGVEPSKILCITYTTTGAMEMKIRINEKLAELVQLPDDKLKDKIFELEGNRYNINEKAQTAKTLFAKILDCGADFKILTIHAFCQQIIKRFPLEANIIPNFQIIDEITSKTLLEEAKELLFNNTDKKIIDAINYIYKYKNDEQCIELLQDALTNINDLLYLRKYLPDIEDIKKRIKKEDIFNLNEYNSKEEIIKEIFDNSIIDYFTEDLCKNIINIKKVAKTSIESIQTIISIKNKGLKNSFEEYINLFSSKQIFTKEVLTKYPELKSRIEAEQKRVYNLYQHLKDYDNYELSFNFITLLYYVLDKYIELKKKKGVLDFQDLIYEVNKLLNDVDSGWINYKLDGGIDHILVDEAQDTSPIQWDIIKSLTTEFFSGIGRTDNKDRTIFVVGDEKQSIFGFQGAEPINFSLNNKYYEEKSREAEKEFKSIFLNTSFRSSESVLKIVDKIFENELRRESISKLEQIIKHNITRDNKGKVEIWPLISDDSEEDGDDNNKEGVQWEIEYLLNKEAKVISKEEKLAITIADKIKEWFDNHKAIHTKDGKRHIQYSDITILYKRRDNNFINYLIREFNKKNIPHTGFDKYRLNDNIVVKDILSLFNFLLFNDDDLNLANIFKSPFLNLTDKDLFELCDYRIQNNCSLFEAMKKNDKYKKEVEFLNDLLKQSQILSITKLMYYIFEFYDKRKEFKKSFLYSADDIINTIFQIADNFENNNTDSNLLSFVNHLKETILEIKTSIDRNLNQVKLMTVHSSKGTESEIVILPDTNHTSKTTTKINEVLNYMNDNIPYKIPLLTHTGFKTDRVNALEKPLKTESFSEYLRLLYVAMTRAKTELYVCDTTIHTKNTDNWYTLIKDAIELCEPKIKYDKHFKERVLYIGEDDETLENNDMNDKTEDNVDELIINNIIKNIDTNKFSDSNILNKKGKQIINPSLLYQQPHTDKVIENTVNINKGKIIHKLLQILPNTAEEERENIMDIMLTDKDYKDEVKNVIYNILNNKEYSFLFSANSQAEVPVYGLQDDEKIISGQIDRLSIVDNIVYIIDYKTTNKLPNKTPENYVKQLYLYKNVIEKIYPDKQIKTYILWTSFGKLEEVI